MITAHAFMQAFPARAEISDHYEMGDLLGEGGYGTVHIATRKQESASDAAATTEGTHSAIGAGGLGRVEKAAGGGTGSEGAKGGESEGGVYVAIKTVCVWEGRNGVSPNVCHGIC